MRVEFCAITTAELNEVTDFSGGCNRISDSAGKGIMGTEERRAEAHIFQSMEFGVDGTPQSPGVKKRRTVFPSERLSNFADRSR